jgi:GAF domain-containing protein
MPLHTIQQNQTVNSLLVLDIVRKQELQDMVELATIICGTPLAMISLTDHEKQHIKFKIGTQLNSLIIEDTFCQYIAKGQDLLVIPDATKDQRFYDNPLVSGSPYIRFYAGIPLIAYNGLRIGSISVLGKLPKEINDSQKLRFKMLAKRVVDILEMELNCVA